MKTILYIVMSEPVQTAARRRTKSLYPLTLSRLPEGHEPEMEIGLDAPNEFGINSGDD